MRKKSIEFLEITTAIGCPVNCLKYCPQEVLLKRYAGKKLMELQDLQDILRTVPKSVKILFSGFCEPFRNPAAVDMMEYAYDQGHPVHLYTTLGGCTMETFNRLKKEVRFEYILLHLPDSQGISDIPVTGEYREVLTAFLTTFPCNVMSMEGNFRTNYRECLARGHPVRDNWYPIECDKLRSRQHVVLPNGDVYLCCIDFSLQEKMGNLLTDTWQSLRDLHRTRTCRGCDLALFTPLYYARGLIQRHIFKGR